MANKDDESVRHSAFFLLSKYKVARGPHDTHCLTWCLSCQVTFAPFCIRIKQKKTGYLQIINQKRQGQKVRSNSRGLLSWSLLQLLLFYRTATSFDFYKE
jgi:hypothetical protein